MPLAKILVSAEIDEAKKKEVLSGVSKAIADVTGKPESYIMVTLQQADVAMAGSSDPAAFADVRGIGGIGGETNKALSAAICDLLSGSLGIASDRVYLNFTDISASNWGWNSATFG